MASVAHGATAKVDDAIARIRHRGPDDSGFADWNAPGVGDVRLGSARLAILDLSPAGHMPMASEDSRFLISYNGEITNYIEVRSELVALGRHFRSSTDTEVLLQAWQEWGADSLARFEGMFAFAVLDKKESTLTLVRDPFGIKPLFYAFESKSFLAFCSELPGLLELLPGRPKLDWQSAFDYLHWQTYDQTEFTFVAGVKQLMPAHYVTLDLASGQLGTPVRYWWPSVSNDGSPSLDEAAERVRELFLTSVRQNLRSDVPVGVALSGGIDSSAIACAVRYLEPDYPLQTFSFVAPGFEQSEDEWIKLVTDATGAQAHYVSSSGTNLMDDLDAMILAQGEPFGSTSIYAQFKVFQRVRAEGVVVTLDGQGADESFAGYSGYPTQRLHSMLERGRVVEAAQFLRAWGTWPDRSSRQAGLEVVSIMLPAPVKRALAKRHAQQSAIFNYDLLEQHGVRTGLPPVSVEPVRGARLKTHLRSEMTSRGLPALLRHGDRNSMNFSVESRVPFLNRALVEYTLSLPEKHLVGSDGSSKNVLRRAMRGIVPDAILDRRDKIGFVTPEQAWLTEMNDASGKVPDNAAQLGMLQLDGAGRAVVDVLPDAELGFGSRERWRLINLRRWVQLLDVDAS